MSTAQLILFLHKRAIAEGRLKEHDPLADEILRTLEGEDRYNGRDIPRGVVIGLELRHGQAHLPEAKAIRSAALRRLMDYDVFLRSVEELGYTPQNIRAALTIHFERLRSEALGSEGNCILMDLDAALKRCTDRTREVVFLLISGLGPQAIGEHFGVNGSRILGRALKTLSRILEGNRNERRSRPLDYNRNGYEKRTTRTQN